MQREVERTRANLRTRLEVYEDALYGTRSLFQANTNVTRAIFRDYVENLKLAQRYPGIQGIGFAIRVRPAEKEAHIQGVRREGYPNYAIRPAGDRAEYTSILYLEPFDWRNQRAFGYDMFSEPIRRAAMQYARDTGQTSLSAKVTLVQETDQDIQAGFLMYLPLYRRGARLDTVEDRRAALEGYIYSPFRIRDLVRELMPDTHPLGFLEIFSGSNVSPESLMYQAPELAQADPAYHPTLTQLAQLQYGGHTWTLRFSSSPAYDQAVRDAQNGFIMPAGVAISVLLFGIIISLGRTENRALRLAEAITARLRRSEERIRAITETATDAIISADSNGQIVYFNPAAERIFRFSARDVVGQPITRLMSERFVEGYTNVFERFVKTGQTELLGTTVEMIGKRSDGAEVPLSVSLSTWHAGGLFFTGILRDISERKLAEEKITALNRELTDALHRSEKLAITGRLVATIAHEINNPLEALMNLLFVLESDQQLSPRSRDFVRLAQEQVRVLSNISRQTLAPYREGKFPSVTNVSELLDDVLSMLRPKLLSSNVQVVRKYPASVQLSIYPSELRQVFTNLAANAIDAMRGGGILSVAVTSADDQLHISVSDTGTGISPEHQDKLFEPFFTTKGESGTGVGLWVVKGIVEKLGGKVYFTTSTLPTNHGTTFTVSLPITVPAEPRKEDDAVTQVN